MDDELLERRKVKRDFRFACGRSCQAGSLDCAPNCMLRTTGRTMGDVNGATFRKVLPENQDAWALTDLVMMSLDAGAVVLRNPQPVLRQRSLHMAERSHWQFAKKEPWLARGALAGSQGCATCSIKSQRRGDHPKQGLLLQPLVDHGSLAVPQRHGAVLCPHHQSVRRRSVRGAAHQVLQVALRLVLPVPSATRRRRSGRDARPCRVPPRLPPRWPPHWPPQPALPPCHHRSGTCHRRATGAPGDRAPPCPINPPRSPRAHWDGVRGVVRQQGIGKSHQSGEASQHPPAKFRCWSNSARVRSNLARI